MELGLRGKAALVTGGSRGIGRACVLELAREGVRLAVCARASADLANVVAEIGGSAAGHLAIAVDLCGDGGPASLAAQLAAEFVPVDIVLHNVGGTLGVRDTFAPAADWRAVWRMNFEVALELNNLLIPAMRSRGWGRVIAISTLAALEHAATAPYSVVKAALTAYARVLGRELAASGVVCSIVVPGTVMTSGNAWEARRQADPSAVERFISERLPAGAFQSAEAVADTVAFLASERASQFIGSTVVVDGGQGRSFAL